ncbi:uncharacterized protein LOC121367090 [Gigantopelta aegis]|uniref:uncharacterized protein LOC121367090 n=1 Tax=Gigantopelta aegis TaxID=1735272 RepID=UPI001B8897A6|nr:uncharacterized protein LOC121367090 [Gigantopelta aegis]
MAASDKKVISLKNVNDLSTAAITVTGSGEFSVIVGLNAEDTVCMVHSDRDEGRKICVPLFLVTVWPTSGMTIAPTNKDLKCFVNSNIITSETNLLPGSVIEIGDKVMEFCDGPVPRIRRRHLPPTPGVRVLPAAPPKPNRNTKAAPSPVEPDKYVNDAYQDWCVIHPPSLEEELVSQLKTPDEIANLAASYLNRQIHLHTDTRMTSSLMDQVFKVLQDVAYHRKDILMDFLKRVARETQEMPEGDNHRPLHDAIICLLVELLKQFLDPVSQVILVLQLLRSLSHIQYNLATLVQCHATAAILGTMSAYLGQSDVQLNSLDILAKIATYTPLPHEKIPLRETGVELVLRAMQHHSTELLIVQAGCRALSNLATMLYETANQIIDTGDVTNPDLGVSLNSLTFLLEHMYQACMIVVQTAVRDFSDDLTIKTDGRKFLYIIAKLSQLQQKKAKWFESVQELDNSSAVSNSEIPAEGILKKSRSFENLRQPERRVFFDDDRAPGVYDSDSSSLTDSDEHRVEAGSTQHSLTDSSEHSTKTSVTSNEENKMEDDCSNPLVTNSEKKKMEDDFTKRFLTENEKNVNNGDSAERLKSSSEESKVDDSPTKPSSVKETKSQIAFDNPIYFEVNVESKHNHMIDLSKVDGKIGEINPILEMKSNDIGDDKQCLDKNVQLYDERDIGDDKQCSDSNVRLYDEIDIVHALVSSQQPNTELTEHNSMTQSNSATCDPLDVDETDSRQNSGEVVNPVCGGSSRPVSVETVGGQLVFVDSLNHAEDLSDCSSVEVNFLIRLMKAQIVCRVCSLALRDEDNRAYRILDRPLTDVLEEEHLSTALRQFVIKQYKPELSLMDLDPSTAISLIDAVRYRSQVAPDVVQKILVGVAKNLNESLRPFCLRLTFAFLTNILDDVALKTIVSDPNFCCECKRHLENVATNLVDRSDIDSVIGKLKTMMGFIS